MEFQLVILMVVTSILGGTRVLVQENHRAPASRRLPSTIRYAQQTFSTENRGLRSVLQTDRLQENRTTRKHDAPDERDGRYGVLISEEPLQSKLIDKPDPSNRANSQAAEERKHSITQALNIQPSVTQRVKSLDQPGHGDVFPCPPCSCSHSGNRYIIANCTHRELSVIPKGLPRATWLLNMTANGLQTLDTSDVLIYPALKSLYITKNQIQHVINTNSTNSTSKIERLFIDDNKINYIKDNSFSLMPSLIELSLGQNMLKNLTNSTFSNIQSLKTLNISWNKIVNIEQGCFDGLTKLQELYLNHNPHLHYDHTHFPPRLFKNLRRLKKLHIQGNTEGETDYPNEALQNLVNLAELNIDAVSGGTHLGPELRTLQHFHTLLMGPNRGKCYLRYLTENFFENIPHITTLDLESCKLISIGTHAFDNVKLHTLKLNYMRNFNLTAAFESLVGLQNSTLKNLSFIDLQLFHSPAPCQYLTCKHGKYLRYIDLEVLDLSNNRLALLRDDFLILLPRTLKTLILIGNKLTLIAFILDRITFLTQLTVLDVSFQNMGTIKEDHMLSSDYYSTHTNISGYTETCGEEYQFSEESKEDTRVHIVNDTNHIFVNYDVHIDIARRLTTEPVFRHHMNIPPKLQVLKASHYKYFGFYLLQFSLNKTNQLREFDFSESFLSEWGIGNIPPGIEKAVLKSNFCKRISTGFFFPNNILKHLEIQNNFLGPSFVFDTSGDIFKNANNVKYLDLSSNLIHKLPNKFFKGLTRVEALRLSDNKLQDLNITFLHMKSLAFLDLSRNSIGWISRESRDDLDSIVSQHELTVDLTWNPLPCTCSELDIIIWMATTKIYFQSAELLYCRHENGKITPMGNIEERMRSLQRSCISMASIIAICVASFVVVGTASIFAVFHRNRWKFRYLRNITKARLYGFKPKFDTGTLFKYDAFMVYAEEDRHFVLHECCDELEKKRGHKLCVKDRDFIPGTHVPENITNAAHNSNKTVPVLTSEFLKNIDEMEQSIMMAVHEGHYQKRDVVFLLLYRPTDIKDMPCHLLKAFMDDHYKEYPPMKDRILKQDFWDQLSFSIGHTANPEQAPAGS